LQIFLVTSMSKWKTFHLSLILEYIEVNRKKMVVFLSNLRLTHFRKTTSISAGYSVQKRYWDDKKAEIKRDYPYVDSVHRLNNLLLKEKAKANDIINKLYDQNQLHYMSIDQVKDRLVKKHKYDSFLAYGDSLVEDLKKAHRYGTARNYKSSLSVLKTFMKGRDLIIQ
jgi:integrase/recombinase XerD